jgi:hypothetical protein
MYGGDWSHSENGTLDLSLRPIPASHPCVPNLTPRPTTKWDTEPVPLSLKGAVSLMLGILPLNQLFTVFIFVFVKRRRDEPSFFFV